MILITRHVRRCCYSSRQRRGTNLLNRATEGTTFLQVGLPVYPTARGSIPDRTLEIFRVHLRISLRKKTHPRCQCWQEKHLQQPVMAVQLAPLGPLEEHRWHYELRWETIRASRADTGDKLSCDEGNSSPCNQAPIETAHS